MSGNPCIDAPGAAWILGFDRYEPREEGQREAILAVGNGVLVTRAAAVDAQRDAVHYPGTYRAGCYNRLASDIAGGCDETESLVNLPNWLPLKIRMPDAPWMHLDHGELLHYAHRVDMRSGIARREYLLQDGAGRQTRFCETRFVSMADPQLSALRLELTPLNWSGDIEFLSTLDGNVANTNVKRYADYPDRHLLPRERGVREDGMVFLAVSTSQSQIHIAQAMHTTSDADVRAVESFEDKGAVGQLFRAAVRSGKKITIDKRVAHCAAHAGDNNNVVAATLSRLQRSAGFDALQAAHEQAWHALWQRTGLHVENMTIVRPLRLHAFHILQTVSPHTTALDAGIPARGWHGEAYHGHIFWDELFVFPFLLFRFPEVARACLMYRHRRLDAAREAAARAGYRGAMYPWRSASDGSEVTPRHQKNLISGLWMDDHTYLQRHVGAAIVFNVWHYWRATGDDAFLSDHGAEMILEIARFWSSIAVPGKEAGRFEIRGVIGPDEYHNAYPWRDCPGLDNNAYTNVMAVWTLCRALELREHLAAPRWQALCRQLHLDDAELVRWDLLSRRMFVPFHDGIINQYEGFERLEEFDPAMLPDSMKDKRVDWALRAIGRNADQFQITKQADALTLFYLFPKEEVVALFARLGYDCADDCILRTARYYLARTAHRSSLSRVVYAGALAQVAPEMSWDFYRHVLDTDLDPLKGESVAEGIHLGAMGGSLDILQRRYLGIDVRTDALSFDPCCPESLCKIRLAIRYRGQLLEVENFSDDLRVFSRPENLRDVDLLFRSRRTRLGPGQECRLPLR